MKRSHLLGRLFVICCVGIPLIVFVGSALSAPKSLAEMKPTLWRTQSCVPLNHYVCQAIVHFKDEVEKRTSGKLRIEVYPSGGMGIPIPKTVSSVQDGLMNMGEILGAFTHGEFPLSDIMELPGLVPGNIDLRKKICEALSPYYEKVILDRYNQYWLGGYQNDARVVALNRKRVSSIAELKGLKLRASGPNEVALCNALGAVPVSIVGPEVYQAMARGTVDACFGADSWLATGKFWEVAKYVYSMEFDGHQMHWTINKQDFDALPRDVQQIVREAAANAIDWVWPEVISNQKSGRQMMIEHGVKYIDISPEDWAKFVEIGKPVVEEWGRKGGPVAQEMLSVVSEIIKNWKR